MDDASVASLGRLVNLETLVIHRMVRMPGGLDADGLRDAILAEVARNRKRPAADRAAALLERAVKLSEQARRLADEAARLTEEARSLLAGRETGRPEN